MPMQRVGNTNYYVIEANVPQPTDTRGRGYGLLVSDQRWKVWDEISKMVAADMKSMGATDDEVRKAHYQEQRLLQTEISQMRRDRNAMLSAAIKSDAATDARNATASATGATWKKSAPKKVTYQAYEETVPDGIGGTVTIQHPERTVITSYEEIPGASQGVTEIKGGGGGKSSSTKSEPTKTAQEAFAPKLEDLDKLIAQKEAELDAMKQTPVGAAPATPQKDFLTQVQERFAAQMGYGGFGLPKSARPAIDYNVGASQLEGLLKMAEDDAEMKHRQELKVAGVTEEPLPEVVADIRLKARAKEFDNIASFFGPKELPVEGPKYNLPLGMGDLGARGEATVLPEEKSGFSLRDLFSFDRGVAPETATTTTAQPTTVVAPATPATPMSTVAAPAAVRDVSMSQPAIAARLQANERERQAIVKPVQVTAPAFNERQAAFDILGAPMPDVSSPTAAPAPTVAPTLEDVQMQRQKESFKDLQKKLEERTTPLTPGLPGSPETGAKMSVPARRDAYALAVVEGGAKLAAQPKKFERLAKTALPQNERAKVVAPFVAIVDKLYSTNAGKSDAFNATYNEISRFYANAPDTRKQAHEYLIAKDILTKNATKPV